MPTEDDIGKRVVKPDGDALGRVVRVREGTAYVDPDTGLIDAVEAALGWEHMDQEAFPLKNEQIAEITDDEVRLGGL